MAKSTLYLADNLPLRKTKLYSAPIRLWHWLNAIVIIGSLITVLINSTLIKGRNITPLIQKELKSDNVAITPEQASSLGHAMQDLVWTVHTWFGYVLAGLLLFRIMLEYFQLADQKFLKKFGTVYRRLKLPGSDQSLAKHNFLVKSIYSVFYLLIVLMVFTGLFLAFEDIMAPFKSIRHTVKEVHGFCMYLIIAFIIVHIAGVFLAERTGNPGITSDMINGGLEKPNV